MKSVVATVTVTVATIALLATQTRVHADTVYCASAATDTDGDGWGYENGVSCIVAGSIADSVVPANLSYASNGTPYCVRDASLSDPDGDGYGWEYAESCIARGNIADPAGTTAPVATTPTPTTSTGFPYCASAASDPDGDGWGWENSASCVVHNSVADTVKPTNLTYASNGLPYCVRAASLSDPDGDGYGWEYAETCIAVGGIADPAGTTAPVATTTPAATASNGYPWCSSPDVDSSGIGWGWENNKVCIVHGSSADPDGATTAPPTGSGKCVLKQVLYDTCTNDTGSYGYENGSICVSDQFCPATKPATQTAQSTLLVDPHATAPARGVFEYLRSIWGSKTIAGIMDLTWLDSADMFARVVNDTGKAPALLGFDFLNYQEPYTVDGQHQVEEAIAHWQKGGIVAFNWHWRVGSNLEFYTERLSSFKIPIKDNQIDTTSEDWTTIVSGLDLIAALLGRLQDAGVPVLWRPLHEASGGWFWWGRIRYDGVPAAYAYTLLYRFMFKYFTETHNLHNLIWVWNGQSQAWYPGDQYVDIVGTDIYDGQQNYASEIASYKALASWPNQVKPVALTENSNIPDPDAMVTDSAWWLWFMVWNDGTAGLHVNDSSNFWTGEYFNTDAHKRAVYNHPNVVTLDKLPAFTVAHYYRCGGIGYVGSTVCEAPFTCKVWNDWYAQCV